MSYGNNAVQVNVGYSQSSSRSSGTTHNNSTISADNIVVNTGGDATFSGANVHADNRLSMSIGGNLTVESRQDSHYASGSSFGINVSGGSNDGRRDNNGNLKGRNSSGGGFNVGSSHSDSLWVNDVTTLTGGTVEINVEGRTTVTGAVIAAGTYDNDNNFTASDQLTLNTGELVFSNLYDFSTNNESGFGLQTNLGGNVWAGDQNLHQGGSTTVTLKNTGDEKAQTTHATIGGGNITVGGNSNPDLAGLNRDTVAAQEITRDMTTGALDGSFTIDNRIFTSDGREQIAGQYENFINNLIIAGAGAYSTVEGTLSQVIDVVSGEKTVSDGITSWKMNQSGAATGIGRGGNDEAQDIIRRIDEGTATPEDLHRLAGMTSDGSMNLVYSNESEVIALVDSNGNVIGEIARGGFNDLENRQGFVNVATGAGTDAFTFLRVDAEERAHNFGPNETLAKAAANNEIRFYNTVARLTGGYTVSAGQSGGGFGTQNQFNWNQQFNNDTSLRLNQNSQIAAAVTGPTADSLALKGAGAGCAVSAAAGCIPGAIVGGGLGAIGDVLIYTGAAAGGAYLVSEAYDAITSWIDSGSLTWSGIMGGTTPEGSVLLNESSDSKPAGTTTAQATGTHVNASGAPSSQNQDDKKKKNNPNDNNVSNEQSARELTTSQQRSIRSYEKRIAEHEKKLSDFLNNPQLRPGTENLSQEVHKQMFESRVRHLQHEIKVFKNNINKIKKGLL